MFDNLVSKARAMAADEFVGDAHEILTNRARTLGVPIGLVPGVLAAFDEEPGGTEWDLMNAVTRFATHDDRVSPRQKEAFQETSGHWVDEYDRVTAKLPRRMASRIGASIIEE